MTDPIPPIGGVGGVGGPRSVTSRSGDRDDRPEQAAEVPAEVTSGLPMVIEPPRRAPPPRSKRAALAAFAAQLMGQGGQKRGLRGGPETLDKARTAYLEAEWSGPSDRRLQTGRITKTEI